MENSGKQYGLLVPKKAGQNLQPRPSVFGDDSDSDSGEGGNWIGKSFKNESVQKRQTKLDIQKALEQDPTVYQYDEVYDEMEEKKMEQKKKHKDPERKPKYIQTLLATAERRKREQERRTERKVQKEREAEGEEFKDKESFVTSAYRKKLEEFQAMDEQERLQDKIEELTDVVKQKDLGGFYRHLFQQTVGDNEGKKEEVKIKEEKDDENCNNEEKNEKNEEDDIYGDLPEPSGLKTSVKVEERSYRKRKVSSSSDSDGGKDDTAKKSKTIEGSDGDTDSSSSDSSSGSSSDSSSSSSEDEEDDGIVKKETEKGVEDKKISEPDETSEKNENPGESKSANLNGTTEDKEGDKPVASGDVEEKEKVPEEPKPNIWEKKTVGPLFDAALQRYLARKAVRMAKLSS
ncbi:nuclear speckle splicing regulatory protein 1-like [Ischnura elegans]|uniref:nuclear speckle splicing regulatory protein 1-like n=1 Tax=Ischnura elegans TaxID=197161 RepID=UPI001ED89160|nr:nuclear speckle splicing regulatory protein 1-like [Ischnura elegans]XP_046385675.1 nuclear speckle splicing regulatory protein 1-like [Ischnura elegans]